MPQPKIITDIELYSHLVNTNGNDKSKLVLTKSSYNYSDIIQISCSIHGITNRKVRDFVVLNQCCGKCIRKNTNKDLIKIYSKEYLNTLFNHISVLTEGRSHDKIKCVCDTHGEFETTTHTFIKSKFGNCKQCGYIGQVKNKFLDKTPEYYINKCNEKYGSKFSYPDNFDNITSSRSIINIHCNSHNKDFTYMLNNFLRYDSNPGCEDCKCVVSKPEIELLEYISSIYYGTIIRSDRSILNGKELDIYIPEYKLAFEFNGIYWHSHKHKPNNYHLDKTNRCEELGIHLIHIYEDEWINKKEIVKSRIRSKLKKDVNKFYGRNTIIKEIDNIIAKDFLNKNHLQGYTQSSVKLGLYKNDELLSVMTFGKLRVTLGNKSELDNYELLRFATKLDTIVIGGANKLFKYFIDNYRPTYILSYADRSWSNIYSNVYLNLNFKLSTTTSPGYYYYSFDNGIFTKYHRYKYRKSNLISLGYDSNKTEFEITDDLKLLRVYNSGNLKFEYKV